MNGRDFIFDCVHLLCFKCYKINLNRDGTYIDSPDWIKNQKATINPINHHGKSFLYAETASLNYKAIGKISQKRLKIKLFINKYNWKGKNTLRQKVEI